MVLQRNIIKGLLYIFLFLPWYSSAQTNESDTLKTQASLSLTGIFQGGNVETIIFRAKSDLSWKPWKKWVVKTKNFYVYQEFGKEKADEDVLSLNFLYLNPEKKLYPLMLAFISTNFRREIELRSLLGGGFSYQLMKKESDWLKLSLTTEYEQTRFDQANFNRSEYNGDRSINTFRATLWVNGKYHLFDKRLVLSHESYFQPSLERSDNYRWQADIAVEVPLKKFLNFKINYLQTFESIVIADQEQEDRFLTFGFTLKNY